MASFNMIYVNNPFIRSSAKKIPVILCQGNHIFHCGANRETPQQIKAHNINPVFLCHSLKQCHHDKIIHLEEHEIIPVMGCEPSGYCHGIPQQQLLRQGIYPVIICKKNTCNNKQLKNIQNKYLLPIAIVICHNVAKCKIA